jgi:hypothetical protein
MQEPVPGISAVPDDNNARYFHVIVAGPEGSPFEVRNPRKNSVAVLRIRIDFSQLDPDPRGHKRPTKIGKSEEFHVLKCWLFSFEG